MNTQVLPKTLMITGSNDKLMQTDIHLNSQELFNQPTVIFCHGYKGFKDWGCWNLVAENFANQGFNFVKFNFSHNGVTPENPLDFVDLEAFGNNNYSKELFDLESVINWVVSDENELKDFFNKEKIYLIGHSRGGGIVSLATAKDNRVAKTITWASVFDLTDRLPGDVEKWKVKGVIHELNGRTNQEMPLYYQFYENTELNKEELSITKQGKKINVPFCIIHGTKDKAVSEEEAVKLNDLISTSEIILLEQAGHTFGSSHPWIKNELPADLKAVVTQSIEFLS